MHDDLLCICTAHHELERASIIVKVAEANIHQFVTLNCAWTSMVSSMVILAEARVITSTEG